VPEYKTKKSTGENVSEDEHSGTLSSFLVDNPAEDYVIS
jgi:hypothetical protein